jgi:hypothetical protein
VSINTNASVPSMSGGPRGRFGRNILVAAAGSVVVAAALGGGLWVHSARFESPSPVVHSPAVAGQPLGKSAAVSHASGGYTPHKIYIVGSEEQATTVSGALNDANAIRNEAGEPLLLDEVVVATSDEAAAAVVSAETDRNGILATQYGVENTIVDLGR